MKKIALLFLPIVLFSSSLQIVSALEANENSFVKLENQENIMYIKNENNSFSYSWHFQKQGFFEPSSLEISNTNDKSRLIEEALETKRVQYITMSCDKLPNNTMLKVKKEPKFRAGEQLTVYYLNKTENKIKKLGFTRVKGETVEIAVDECEEYILVSFIEKNLAASITNFPASIVKTAMDNPASMGIIIIVLLVIAVAAVGYTLLKKKR